MKLFFSAFCMMAVLGIACTNSDKKTAPAETAAPRTAAAEPAPPVQVVKDTAPAVQPPAARNTVPKEWAFTLDGAEPSWNMMITSNFFHFSSRTPGFEQLNAPASAPAVSGDGNMISYSPSTPAMQMRVRLEKGKCDDKTGKKYSYKATVEIKRARDKEFTTFTGCANQTGR